MTLATDRGGRRRKARPPLGTKTGAFLSRLATQWRVIRALMIRDMMGRYGRENIGFLWLIGEPALLIGGVVFLWSLMRGSSTHGLSMIVFALTGYSMLTLWRHMVSRGTGILRVSGGLLFHQDVRVVDTVLSQILMESITTFMSFLFCYTLFFLLGYVEFVYDPLLMVIAWVLMTLFAGGIAMMLGGFCAKSKPFERMLQPVMYFTLPLTGAFTLVVWMPESLRRVMVWIPMIQAQEMFRAGFTGPSVTYYYDPWYLFMCGILTMSFGLAVLKWAESDIHIG
ncbi:ABC transporter permease [Jiella mangrovi]|uniref:ABC transporter permease n=1 Tax=Jiella mangrovi TaxID=2821407 RepID=A0ABS4BMC3_9HYPH|nr:ABC transporter permease [Jiella mangrovi]MBP0617874.1 ABC transporter permease [Jiella mangrovi]